MLVTLPFVLLLLDFWPLGRFGWPPGAAGRRAVVEKLPLFAMVAGVSVVTWLVQQASGTMSYGAELSFSARLANAVDATVFYFQKSLWPSGLAAFYPLRLEGLPPLRVAAEALLLALLSLLALLRARRTPAVFVGWFWFLGVLVPVIGLVQVGEQAYADRYSYLPMVGLSIALAWGASSLARGRAQRRALALAGAVAVAALAVAARAQVEVWRNSERLFEHAARVAPENGFVQLRLATLRLRAGELDAAERHYRRFYELRPEEGRDRLVRFHLGMADRQSRAGNPDAALSRYRQVLEVAPDHARANARLGLALLAAGEPARARPYLERAVHASPGSWELHEGLAQTAAAAARFDAAARHYREALRLEPAQASLRNNLAWLLATCPDASVRDPAAALRLAEALVAEQPGAQELDTLAAAYAAAGRFDEARQAQRRAIAAAEMQGATAAARLFRQRAEAYARGDAWIEPAPEPAAP